MPAKLRLGVFKFASCDGCQLSLLSLEDDLLELAEKIDVVYFLEATSRIEPGPYDLALIEGSITTAADAERIQLVRRDSRLLVTIGACATAGGIQSLRNWANHDDYLRAVYARPDYIESLATSTPIAAHVRVDFELRGCPVNRWQLLEVLSSLLRGHRPQTPTHSVCLECKRRGTVCVMVAAGTPCLGPITQAGCGALCPAYDRACYGCFGPCGQANPRGWSDYLSSQGTPQLVMIQALRSFNADAAEFRSEGNRLETLSPDTADEHQ